MEDAASAARRAAARASVLGDGASITRVLLFDVDGTLVKSSAGSNAVHRDAFTHAIAAVHGLQGVRISEIPHDGMTDMWIVDELMKARGVPADVVSARMDDVKREMVAYCRCEARRVIHTAWLTVDWATAATTIIPHPINLHLYFPPAAPAGRKRQKWAWSCCPAWRRCLSGWRRSGACCAGW